MPQYTFSYVQIPLLPSDPFPNGQTVARPLLAVHVIADNGLRVTCPALVDSGADSCIFPLSFAKLLGLDPLNMKMQMTGGVGSTNVTYYETVSIEILNPGGVISFKTYAGFTSGMDGHGLGLLGQSGFFETYAVALNHKLKVFTITTA